MIKDDERIICPKCKNVVIELLSVTDDGKGEPRVCRLCKRKIKKKEEVKRKMVEKKALKLSEMSMDRLKAYAENYKLVKPEGSNEDEERQFYIDELVKKNEGKDQLRTTMEAGVYKGVNSCICSDCGETKSVRAEVYAKRVEKFGSEENLKANYKCMECRRKA